MPASNHIHTETWPSGRRRALGERLSSDATRVRISTFPPSFPTNTSFPVQYSRSSVICIHHQHIPICNIYPQTMTAAHNSKHTAPKHNSNPSFLNIIHHQHTRSKITAVHNSSSSSQHINTSAAYPLKDDSSTQQQSFIHAHNNRSPHIPSGFKVLCTAYETSKLFPAVIHKCRRHVEHHKPSLHMSELLTQNMLHQ